MVLGATHIASTTGSVQMSVREDRREQIVLCQFTCRIRYINRPVNNLILYTVQMDNKKSTNIPKILIYNYFKAILC